VLAGRSQRTALRTGDHFLFERRDGVLVFEKFLTQPDSMHVDIPIFTPCFSNMYLLLRSSIYCIAELYIFTAYHKHLIQSSGKRGIRERLYVILGATTTRQHWPYPQIRVL
jgi:hypothetical protein